MSNLIFKQNSKNQIGVGTNKIELTNSLSSALNIKKNDDSYSFLEFNTSSNTIGVGTNMAANDVIIFKGTTKITTLSKGSLVYLDSSGNWVGLGTVGIGSYIQVNSGGTGLQWTGIKPSIALTTKSPSHNSTMSANSDNIILTFDEPIIAGTGNIVLTPSSGSAITIDVTNTSLVSFSSNVCTINPSSNLDPIGLTYTVTMASGVIKNSNGDLFNGISGTAYQFNSKDTTAPVLSNASSIGTTTDTTPTLTFTSSEAGTITSSLSFSTSTSAIAGGNSITFNTLSNNTYSSQWVKVTDALGNTSNQLTIPTFIVAANPYSSSDLRYHMWNQNMQTGSETRGYVGYVNISCIIQGTTFYVHNAHTSWRGVAYFTTNPVHQNIRTSSNWWPTVDFNDGNGRGDEHTFKIEYNSTNNNYTITPDNSVWINGSYDNPFIHDMRLFINGTGTSANTYSDPAVNITHITGNKWRLYNATAGNGSDHKIIYGQKSGYYTTTLGYGYVAILAPTPSITTYTGSLSTYSSDETIFTFI